MTLGGKIPVLGGTEISTSGVGKYVGILKICLVRSFMTVAVTRNLRGISLNNLMAPVLCFLCCGRKRCSELRNKQLKTSLRLIKCVAPAQSQVQKPASNSRHRVNQYVKDLKNRLNS